MESYENLKEQLKAIKETHKSENEKIQKKHKAETAEIEKKMNDIYLSAVVEMCTIYLSNPHAEYSVYDIWNKGDFKDISYGQLQYIMTNCSKPITRQEFYDKLAFRSYTDQKEADKMLEIAHKVIIEKGLHDNPYPPTVEKRIADLDENNNILNIRTIQVKGPKVYYLSQD